MFLGRRRSNQQPRTAQMFGSCGTNDKNKFTAFSSLIWLCFLLLWRLMATTTRISIKLCRRLSVASSMLNLFFGGYLVPATISNSINHRTVSLTESSGRRSTSMQVSTPFLSIRSREALSFSLVAYLYLNLQSTRYSCKLLPTKLSPAHQ